MPLIVTFDLFSALTDSRTGASTTFTEIATERGWALSGTQIYDAWDTHNKALQRDARLPVTFRQLCVAALVAAYDDLGLPREHAPADMVRLHGSVPAWPLWPDVADGVAVVARNARVGLLSNVDDDLARVTRAYALVDPGLVLSSQRLGTFKPKRAFYLAAVQEAAPARLVHVAASARDIRGSLEAGVTTIRLARPGHVLDPAGPLPSHQVQHAADLHDVLSRLS